MHRRAWLFCILPALLLADTASAAVTLMPDSDAVAGWQRQERLRRFTAADLYGHINGGAELFLELGFEELLVQRYINGEQEITLELYRMESPLAALAIYLFKCGQETSWPEIEARNSSGRFQSTLVRGDCFVMVNSFSGDRALRPAMTGLAGALLESIPVEDAGDPFAALPAAGRLAGSERLIRGEYSLQSLYTLGPGDVLQLGGKLFGMAADYLAGEGGHPETRIRVAYPGEKEASAAFAHLVALLDPALEPLEQGANRLVFRDFSGRFGVMERDGPVIEVLVHLAARPAGDAVSTAEP
jgi:hypothetical protein